MITAHDVAQTEHIIDSSGVVDILIGGYRTDNRGRKTNANKVRLMLLGMLLSIHHNGKSTLTASHRLLTEDIPLGVQERLGVIDFCCVEDSDVEVRRELVSLDDFYNIERKITKRLAYGPRTRNNGEAPVAVEAVDDETAPETSNTPKTHESPETPETPEVIDDTERDRRHDVIRTYCDSLMDVFQLRWTSSVSAIDATGVWSWGRGYGKPKTEKNGKSSSPVADTAQPSANNGAEKMALLAQHVEHCDSVGDAVDSASSDDRPNAEDGAAEIDGTPVKVKARLKRRDLDAEWGYKTSKLGEPEQFFGYHEHTIVQVPGNGHEKDDEPRLIQRFELTHAKTDVVDVSLDLLSRMPVPVTDLLVDRHYHYKTVDRWKRPLNARGIRQHLDLRVDEHGFTEYDRMRWAAGHAHCPATPDAFGTILRPGPGASKEDMAAFRLQIAKREAFSMRRVDTPDEHGTHRVQCPALCGKVGCGLRAGTEAAALILDLPRVENPPNAASDGEPLPKCCTQQTVRTTPPDSIFKLMQRYYWGGPHWEPYYAHRTYVEGSYGNRKNVSTENLRRGLIQIFGLTWTHIVLGLVNASYNLRILENWYERQGHLRPDLADNLLVVEDTADIVGFVAVSAAEYDQLRRMAPK